MAGRGPAPKPASKRARGGGPDLRVVEFTPTPQPPLPDSMAWCDETVEWWRMWGESPLAAEFSATDWAFLLDTAILHHMLWSSGDISVLGELRIRVAKFGATPEDRARLRVQFATADEAEAKAERRVASARDRRAGLTSVKPDAAGKTGKARARKGA